MKNIIINGEGLTVSQVESVVRGKVKISLGKEVRKRVNSAQRIIQKAIDEKKVIYGVTTGFGALSGKLISKDNRKQLQKNIVLSHSAGVGSYFDEEIVRGVMLLRINDCAKGHSCIRFETLQTLVEMLNKGVHPVIPEKGSVGASGDLAPLAHLALVLIGEGKAVFEDKVLSGRKAMKSAGIELRELEAGEGLALINGTQVMTGIGSIVVADAVKLLKSAEIAAGMSLEVLRGSNIELNERIHNVRPHKGQRISADNLRRITENSDIISSHEDCSRVQDAYSIRCCPQVHGASIDTLNYVKNVIETEMNSATGNPLIFHDTNVVYNNGGNFHGQPVALAMDFLAIALSEIADISERRIERLVNPLLSGLPAFLVDEPGLNSGLMIAQYTAASLVSENKVLAHPASVDSIPTSANKEDHVSMGTIAARKCRQVLFNTENVIAIELLCVAQALDLFTNLKAGSGSICAYREIRKHVPHLKEDRIISDDIKIVHNLVRDGIIVSSVEKKTGALSL
ncbi:histidine ammonia-lyase [Candidatus Scalindua japonica]|nr:histidine ammonia-lyase [Candidatus Scalindua japonica]